MPVIRITDATWERLKRWAVPLDDSPDDAVRKVLDAAEEHLKNPPSNLGAIPPITLKPRRLSYVSEAKDLYDSKKINAEEFISSVWDGIKKNANDEHVVERATKAFLKLYKEGNSLPVEGKAILKDAGLAHNGGSHNLWPWLGNHANVIKQTTNTSGQKEYSVDDTFYNTLRKVCLVASDES